MNESKTGTNSVAWWLAVNAAVLFAIGTLV